MQLIPCHFRYAPVIYIGELFITVKLVTRITLANLAADTVRIVFSYLVILLPQISIPKKIDFIV